MGSQFVPASPSTKASYKLAALPDGEPPLERNVEVGDSEYTVFLSGKGKKVLVTVLKNGDEFSKEEFDSVDAAIRSYAKKAFKESRSEKSIHKLHALKESLLTEGADLRCPNCNATIGKMSEVESDANDGAGSKKGKKIKVYCSECGQSFTHTTQYDTVD